MKLAAPFDRWPLQHVVPRYGYAWYCGKGRIVSVITVTHGTEEGANAYHDFEGTILRDHAAAVERYGGIFVVHDWRALATYDSAARKVWQERMQTRKKGYLRGSVVCLARATPLLRMAVQGANLVAAMTSNAKVELSTDVPGALAAQGITMEDAIAGSDE